jgi:Kef-type K+ transport system membrane component KefB/nucleotide-binding universal stress UspA family protein
MRFQALTEHQLLVLWVQLFVLVFAARGLGGAARRVGQPAVVGELVAGVVLGPSVLGVLAPGFWAWLFPPDAVHAGLMAGIGWLGVFLLLVLAGRETDLTLVQRLGRAAVWVSSGSLLVPLVFGLGVGLVLPATFIGSVADRSIFAAFMATALAISSLPVVAKVLTELGLVRRDFGQLTLAAGMANDVVGWMLLGIIASLAQVGAVDVPRVLSSIGGLLGLVAVAMTLGRRFVDALLRDVQHRGGGEVGAVTVIVLVALAMAAATQAIGVEGVLGAFIAGVVLGRSRYHNERAFTVLETVTHSFLAPIFFARAGLRVDLTALTDPTVAGWTGVVIAAATISKIVGAFAGARLAGLTSREGLALGAGLNARGALEIVVASVGLTLGVLNQASYSVVVVMAIATSMMAPIMLRLVARGWQGSPAEHERLSREQVLSRNIVVRPQRLLLPSHGGPNSELAARLLDLVWPEGVEATVLSVGRDVVPGDIDRVCAAFTARPVEHEHLEDDNPLEAILGHAKLGYGAVGVGATDQVVTGRLISSVVDALLSNCPVPVIMVRGAAGAGAHEVRRIVVPAVGTAAGRAALEVAFGMARGVGAVVEVAHVLTRRASSTSNRALSPEGRTAVGHGVLADAVRLADELGVRANPQVRTGRSASEELVALAEEVRADVLVVTANVRRVSERPFLGHGVEHLLEHSPCTLVVVATPPGWERP